MAQRQLRDLQEHYKWGKTDCLVTVGYCLEALEEKESYDKWINITDEYRQIGKLTLAEYACGKEAIRKWKSISNALKLNLEKVGFTEIEYIDRFSLLPYDVLFLEGLSTIENWDIVLGFVDEDLNVRTWMAQTKHLDIILVPLISKVFRLIKEEN